MKQPVILIGRPPQSITTAGKSDGSENHDNSTASHFPARPSEGLPFESSWFPRRILEGFPPPTDKPNDREGNKVVGAERNGQGSRTRARGTPTEARPEERRRSEEREGKGRDCRPHSLSEPPLRQGELFRALARLLLLSGWRGRGGEGGGVGGGGGVLPRYPVRDTFRMFCSRGGKAARSKCRKTLARGRERRGRAQGIKIDT